jgi:hypothetical protein
MSLNWVTLTSGRKPLPLEDESIIRTEPETIFTLNLPAPQSRGNISKGKERDTSMTANGTLYFTTERVSQSLFRHRPQWSYALVTRVNSYHFWYHNLLLTAVHLFLAPPYQWARVLVQLIFVSSPAPDASFQSFSVHYTRIPTAVFKQPLFTGNSIEFEISVVPNGGLSPGSTGQIRFKDRGLTEAYATLNKNRERALHRKREELLNGPDLREYHYQRPSAHLTSH